MEVCILTRFQYFRSSYLTPLCVDRGSLCRSRFVWNFIFMKISQNFRICRVVARLGEHKISTDPDCYDDDDCQDSVQDIHLKNSTKHLAYDIRKRVNDIAMLRLKTGADTSKRNFGIICLPTTADNQIEMLDHRFRKKMIIAG